MISLKYLHDDIYHRAYDSVYLKKFKSQSSIYLTIYGARFWVGWQHLWIQQLTTIEYACNANSGYRQKWQSG